MKVVTKMGASPVALLARGHRSTVFVQDPRAAGHLVRGRETEVLECGTKKSCKPINRTAKLSSFPLGAFALTSDVCLGIICPKFH